MRASPLSAIALVALLVLAGCLGVSSSGENGPSPDEFPNASDIDSSVFDTHASEVANTSFTLSSEKNRTDRNPSSVEKNFRYMNETSRSLVEPGASQYLGHFNGYFSGNGTIYSNGSTEYLMPEEGNESMVRDLSHRSVFNESGEYYLWRGWFNNESGNQLEFAAIDATYEREGLETFQGVSVMRYEATGVDTLPDWWVGENASYFEEFSATLLLDEDGVIRHYEYEFVWADYHTRRIRQAYTLSNVGSTDVQKPDWAANAVSNTTSGT